MTIKLYFCFFVVVGLWNVVIGMERSTSKDSIILNPQNLSSSMSIPSMSTSPNSRYYCSAIVYDNYVQVRAQEQEIEMINRQDLWGETLLFSAVRKANISEIKKLFKYGICSTIVNLAGETALSLMLKHEKTNEMRAVFEENGHIFISHSDLYNNSLSRLLGGYAAEFNRIIKESMHGSKIELMMKTLNTIFTEVSTHEIQTTQSNIVTVECTDCLIKMTIQKMYELFGELTIKMTQNRINAYFAMPSFIETVNSECYDQLPHFLIKYPYISIPAFHHYIMEQLASNKAEKCWQKLIEMRFRYHNFGPLLHLLAGAQNNIALYLLIYHGADCTVKNNRDKTCLDLFFTQFASERTKEKAKECLNAIKKACYDRRINKPDDIKSEEDLKLLEIEAKIHSVIK